MSFGINDLNFEIRFNKTDLEKSSLGTLSINDKTFEVQVFVDSKLTKLSDNQQKELNKVIASLIYPLAVQGKLKTLEGVKITEGGVFYKPETSVHTIRAKPPLKLASVEETIQKKVEEVLQDRPASPKKASFVEAGQHRKGSEAFALDTSKTKHLFLKESYEYVSLFMDKLADKVEGPAKQQIIDLKDRTLDQLMNEIYSGHKEWLGDIDRFSVKEEWSSKEEGIRQREASKLLNLAMYEALNLAKDELVDKARAKPGQDKISDKEILGRVHKAVCLEIAKEKAKNVLDEQNKINIEFNFDVPIDSQSQINVNIHTQQFGDKIMSSLEKRVPDPQGKVYGVNMHTEQVDFQSPTGKTVTVTQLRSGSFDFHDVEPAKLDKPLPANPFYMQQEVERFKTMSATNIMNEVNRIRVGQNPQALSNLIEILKAYRLSLPSDQSKRYETLLPKLEKELEKMIKDKAVIEKNKECMLDLFTQVEGAAQEGHKLGLVLPYEVQEIFRDDPELGQNNQNWGMISLLTPVNITAGKGINRLILEQSQNSKLPGFIRGALKLLANTDSSELDPTFREMTAFNQAAKAKGNVKHGLYFNIPTNVLGAKIMAFHLGPFNFRFKISSKLNVGLVDKFRSAKINKETQKNIQTIYNLSNHAKELVERRMRQLSKDSSEQVVLQTYLNSLEDLIEQTFEIKQEDAQTQVKLKIPPGLNAQYESVGRLTVLMDMLNFNTTGHCRSGNNRTAAWLAKSHQIVGAMAASEDGRIPTPEEMAGTLATHIQDKLTQKVLRPFKKPNEDHWSLDIFLNCFQISLMLQQANKGTQGTKLNVSEIRNKNLRKATVKGAFDLAGRFDPAKLEEVAKRKETQT